MKKAINFLKFVKNLEIWFTRSGCPPRAYLSHLSEILINLFSKLIAVPLRLAKPDLLKRIHTLGMLNRVIPVHLETQRPPDHLRALVLYKLLNVSLKLILHLYIVQFQFLIHQFLLQLLVLLQTLQ